MATHRLFTGFLTVDLGTGENVGAGDTLTISSAPPLTIILVDTDPVADGDPVSETSSDPGGDQVAFIQDSTGTVLEDGGEFYLEMSFVFTDSAGNTHTGYQFEMEGGTGRDFVILPPGVAPGDITVNSINFVPNPDEVDYDLLASGDEAVDPADFANLDLSGDDILIGGAGNDTIEAGAGQDTVFGNDGDDSVNAGSGDDFIVGDALDSDLKTRLSFNWDALPDPDDAGATTVDDGDVILANTGDSISQDTGGMNVAVSMTDINGNTDISFEGTTGQYTTGIDSGSETTATTSAGRFFSSGGLGDAATIQIDFSPSNGTFADYVENVSFRINDIDQGGWRDILSFTATDADGNPVQINLTPGTSHTVSDTDGLPGDETATAGAAAGGLNSGDAAGSLLVEIPGPVSQITITYGNLATGGQLVDVTDIFFDAGPAAPAGDDTLIGADGDDNILGGVGDDVLIGDQGGAAVPFTYEFYELNGQNPATLADAGFDASGNNSNTPDATGTATNFDPTAVDTAEGGDGDTFAVKYTTTLTVTSGGTYDFDLTSDDGSILFINGVEVVNNDGLHASQTASGSVSLPPGEHVVEVLYFENGGGEVLSLDMSGPDTGGAPIAFETANIQTTVPTSGDDTLAGGDGSDTLNGDVGADSVSGGADEDLILLTDAYGNDTIAGGETTTTGTDVDTIDASGISGYGVDLTYSAAEAGTISGAGDTAGFTEIESVILTDQDDTVDASALTTGIVVDTRDGDDTILGGDGADTILAGAGDDTIAGGSGADVITAGSGDDIADYTASNAGVTVDLSSAGAQSGGHAQGDVLSGVDGVLGSDFADSLTGFDGTFDDPISNTLDGGAGNDTLAGGGGADILLGGADADSVILEDGFGADTITGGEAGTDSDVIDASAITSAVDVTYSGNEAGTLTDGTDSALFSEIEGVILTAQDDTVDASATTNGVSVDGAQEMTRSSAGRVRIAFWAVRDRTRSPAARATTRWKAARMPTSSTSATVLARIISPGARPPQAPMLTRSMRPGSPPRASTSPSPPMRREPSRPGRIRLRSRRSNSSL